LDATRDALTVGETTTLRAVPLDATGTPLAAHPVRWTSSQPSLAHVSPQGTVTARAPGTVRLTATADGITSSVTMSIEALRAASVRLSTPPALREGGTARLAATVQDAAGRPLETAVQWRSSNTSVAVVDGGVITARGAGTADITAVADGQQATVSVKVTAPEPAVVPNPAVSTPPSPAPSEPVRAEPTPAENRAAIEAAIQRYARALMSQQLPDVRAAYAGITPEEEARFNQTLRTLQQLRVTLTLGELTFTRADEATAVVQAVYEFYSPENRRMERINASLNARLERGTSQWLIRSIR
jgi:hypothetical protein